MRRLVLFLAAIALLVSCATTESAEDTEIAEDATTETERIEDAAPEWFDASVTTTRDSVAFYGFSHSVASTESEALDMAEEMAQSNLRFGVDRFTEDVRRELENQEGSEPYATSRFIIDLRNAVQDLDFPGAETETEVFDKNGSVDVFVRLIVSHEEVIERLSQSIGNEQFISEMRRKAAEE